MQIDVLVDGEGLPEIEVIQISEDAPLAQAVEAIAERMGGEPSAYLVFVENEDEPCDTSLPVPAHQRRRVHHVHHHRRIDVKVGYAGEEAKRAFSPSTTIRRVLDWAIGPDGFKIDPAFAAEMRLALPGAQDPLPNSAHIGCFAKEHGNELELALLRGVIPNGRG